MRVTFTTLCHFYCLDKFLKLFYVRYNHASTYRSIFHDQPSSKPTLSGFLSSTAPKDFTIHKISTFPAMSASTKAKNFIHGGNALPDLPDPTPAYYIFVSCLAMTLTFFTVLVVLNHFMATTSGYAPLCEDDNETGEQLKDTRRKRHPPRRSRWTGGSGHDYFAIGSDDEYDSEIQRSESFRSSLYSTLPLRSRLGESHPRSQAPSSMFDEDTWRRANNLPSTSTQGSNANNWEGTGDSYVPSSRGMAIRNTSSAAINLATEQRVGNRTLQAQNFTCWDVIDRLTDRVVNSIEAFARPPEETNDTGLLGR